MRIITYTILKFIVIQTFPPERRVEIRTRHDFSDNLYLGSSLREE